MALDTSFELVVGGERVTATERFPVLNPATESIIAQAPECSKEQLDQAVAAARAAFAVWSALPFDERRAKLVAFSDAILAQTDELKRLLTLEQGKPHADAEMEIIGAAYYLKGTLSLDLPVTVAEDSAERRVETRHLPIGVVGAIAPWNFPIILAMFKIGPALLAGNTMVLKPSPFTPLTTLRIGEIARGILPPGVLNIVTGTDRLGPWLTEHPGIDKVTFTGSTQTGRRVMQSAAATLKRITLELGGNDAAIVLPDVNVEEAAEQIFWAAFRNNGQICIATKRLYVHEDIYDRFKDALVAYARTVKVGDGAEQGTQIGPVNNKAQYDRVLDLIADARDKGYTFLLGGEASDIPGYFIPVTLIDNPPEDARIVQEEQFGPALPLLKFKDIDDVIRRANDSEYGLGGSVWSADEEKAAAIASRIASGTVWINDTQYLTPLASFGGHKQSGLGVEGGIEGLLEYTVPQTIIRRKKLVQNA